MPHPLEPTETRTCPLCKWQGQGRAWRNHMGYHALSGEIVMLSFAPTQYLEALELLGSGVFVLGAGEPAVQPLPRYRKRTRDGRHNA